jgi:hypothetical protein
MDISRIPATPLLRPASAPVRTTRQPASDEAGRVESLNPRPAGGGFSGPVVQGELLHREHASYQSTRAFIDERSLDQAQPAGLQAESFTQARAAISRYLNNTRPEAGSEIGQGSAVNFFV